MSNLFALLNSFAVSRDGKRAEKSKVTVNVRLLSGRTEKLTITWISGAASTATEIAATWAALPMSVPVGWALRETSGDGKPTLAGLLSRKGAFIRKGDFLKLLDAHCAVTADGELVERDFAREAALATETAPAEAKEEEEKKRAEEAEKRAYEEAEAKAERANRKKK